LYILAITAHFPIASLLVEKCSDYWLTGEYSFGFGSIQGQS